MKFKYQCNKCGELGEIDTSVLTGDNLDYFVGDIIKLKNCKHCR